MKGADVVNVNSVTQSDNNFSPEDPMYHFNLDSLAMLQPEESYAYSFIINAPSGYNGRLVGAAEMKWNTFMGEHGIMKGDDVLSGSSTNNNNNMNNPGTSNSSLTENRAILLTCMKSPSSAMIGKDFEVTIRITNNTSQPMEIQLRCNNNSINDEIDGLSEECSLYITGLSCSNVGILGSGEFIDKIITVCAVSGGLHELSDICAMDTSTLISYPSGPICQIFIYDELLGKVEN
jgi:hypothetical protein